MGTVSVVQLAADVLTVAKLLPSRVLASRSTSAQTTRLARGLATPRFFVVAPRGVVGRAAPGSPVPVGLAPAAGRPLPTCLTPARLGAGADAAGAAAVTASTKTPTPAQ